jgi:hypothetical protein
LKERAKRVAYLCTEKGACQRITCIDRTESCYSLRPLILAFVGFKILLTI